MGGCLLELTFETDDALQQKKFFVNIFPTTNSFHQFSAATVFKREELNQSDSPNI
jgi:hypothetical protein